MNKAIYIRTGTAIQYADTIVTLWTHFYFVQSMRRFSHKHTYACTHDDTASTHTHSFFAWKTSFFPPKNTQFRSWLESFRKIQMAKKFLCFEIKWSGETPNQESFDETRFNLMRKNNVQRWGQVASFLPLSILSHIECSLHCILYPHHHRTTLDLLLWILCGWKQGRETYHDLD